MEFTPFWRQSHSILPCLQNSVKNSPMQTIPQHVFQINFCLFTLPPPPLPPTPAHIHYDDHIINYYFWGLNFCWSCKVRCAHPCGWDTELLLLLLLLYMHHTNILYYYYYYYQASFILTYKRQHVLMYWAISSLSLSLWLINIVMYWCTELYPVCHFHVTLDKTVSTDFTHSWFLKILINMRNVSAMGGTLLLTPHHSTEPLCSPHAS